MLGNVYTYANISNLDYFLPGKIHTFKRPDFNFAIAVAKFAEEQETKIDVQVCFTENPIDDSDWFTVASNLDTVTDAEGSGQVISLGFLDKINGLYGVRIRPKDNLTVFIFTVFEYPNSDKISSNEPSNYLVR